jgi:hypothetical protein
VRVFVAPRLRIIVRRCGLQEDNSVTAWTRIGSAAIAALLVVAPAAEPDGFVRGAAAAERALSDTQLKKINGWIAEKGRTIEVSEIITDILGLTQNNETMTSRAFATRDSENADEIHVIFILPAEGLSGGALSSRPDRGLLGRQQPRPDIGLDRYPRRPARRHVISGSKGRLRPRPQMVGEVRRGELIFPAPRQRVAWIERSEIRGRRFRLTGVPGFRNS